MSELHVLYFRDHNVVPCLLHLSDKVAQISYTGTWAISINYQPEEIDWGDFDYYQIAYFLTDKEYEVSIERYLESMAFLDKSGLTLSMKNFKKVFKGIYWT